MKKTIAYTVMLISLFIGACTTLEKKEAEPKPAEQTKNTNSTSSEAAKPATVNPAYNEKEYRLYREVMEAPMSEPENKVLERLGKKYGMSPKEAKAAVERVMTAIHSGGAAKNQSQEQEVRNAVEKLAQVKTIVVSSEFASVTYVEKETALNDADVKRKILNRMPQVLEAIFSVSGIDRVRLIAYYPTTNGGESKVSSLEAYRSEFKLGKRPEEYREFWVRQ
jgi:hypothetical protein